MGSFKNQYLFALLFIGVGIFQGIKNDFLEFAMYTVAGMAFLINALTLEPKLIKYKKTLVVITWVLIIAACLLFLYVLQFKF